MTNKRRIGIPYMLSYAPLPKGAPEGTRPQLTPGRGEAGWTVTYVDTPAQALELLKRLPEASYMPGTYRLRERLLKNNPAGGLSADRSPSQFDPIQLEIGTRVEMEHTKSRKVARKIAQDHLTEDRAYYYKLAEMEAGALGKAEPACGCEVKTNPRGKGDLVIVIAWTVTDMEVVRERRTDLGERPIMREVQVPRAAVWLKRGTAADVQKAEAYAQSQGYRVFTYPVGEKDPLGRAKRDVMAKQNPTRWSDGMILESVQYGHGLSPQAQERAYELIDEGFIDATGTWKLTPKGRKLLHAYEGTPNAVHARRNPTPAKKPYSKSRVRALGNPRAKMIKYNILYVLADAHGIMQEYRQQITTASSIDDTMLETMIENKNTISQRAGDTRSIVGAEVTQGQRIVARFGIFKAQENPKKPRALSPLKAALLELEQEAAIFPEHPSSHGGVIALTKKARKLGASPGQVQQAIVRGMKQGKDQQTDLVGTQVYMDYQGHRLLGDVIGFYPSEPGIREHHTAEPRLIVRHFNKEPWPIDPYVSAVHVLERSFDETLENPSGSYAPDFIHDTVQMPDGTIREGKNAWHPRMGKPTNASLAAAVRRMEQAHPGERVISAEVRSPSGKVKARYAIKDNPVADAADINRAAGLPSYMNPRPKTKRAPRGDVRIPYPGGTLIVTNTGMMPGFYRIITEDGSQIASGMQSKAYAIDRAQRIAERGAVDVGISGFRHEEKLPRRNPTEPSTSPTLLEKGYVFQLTLLDGDAKNGEPKEKAYQFKRFSHIMLHDPSGRQWPKCDVLMMKGQLKPQDSQVRRPTEAAKDYFGAVPIFAQSFHIPPKDYDGWKEVGQCVEIYYDRVGATEDPFHHPFDRSALPILYTTTIDGKKFWRLSTGQGCEINERGYVWP